jgi:hypothetical protein
VPYWKFFISYFLVAFHKKGLVQNCSNFIFNAMNKVGYQLTKKNTKYITPSDFERSKQAMDVTGELPAGVKHGIIRRIYGEVCNHITSL